jgi:hypothetical protein
MVDRGLAKKLHGPTIEINYELRQMILSTWPIILREPARQNLGIEIFPITDSPQFQSNLLSSARRSLSGPW